MSAKPGMEMERSVPMPGFVCSDGAKKGQRLCRTELLRDIRTQGRHLPGAAYAERIVLRSALFVIARNTAQHRGQISRLFVKFTVTVSAQYEDKEYRAQASISLESKPAQVSLDKLDSYYILDTAGRVDIGWNVSKLDRASGADLNDLLKFQITKGGQNVPAEIKPELDNGSASGTFTLKDLEFDADEGDPSSYRQVYTVTLQAKNGEDSTWSYDSFLLYVYDADALKIMVDAASADSAIQMSNIAEISQMSQEQILALKRDIWRNHLIDF